MISWDAPIYYLSYLIKVMIGIVLPTLIIIIILGSCVLQFTLYMVLLIKRRSRPLQIYFDYKIPYKCNDIIVDNKFLCT